MVELQLGGTWTDVTDWTYLRDRIRIVRGRQDQGARVDPGSCTLTLNNKLGRFSPRNPLGPYYGQLTRNTAVRVSTAAGAPWLAQLLSTTGRLRASTPSTSALNITGDLDARFDVRPDNWFPSSGSLALGGKWGAAGQRSWHLYLNSGFVEIGWTTDGTTETTIAASLANVELTPRMVVRVTMDVNNGAGGRDVTFYVGPTMNGPWTQVAAPQTVAGTSATASSTAPVEIGDISSLTLHEVPGRLYAAQIRSGIGGTIVAEPDFTAQQVGALSFTDAAGVLWTASSADAITNALPRFVGEISAWPAQWDVSGGDVYVQVQAAGIMRRLGQGADPLRSTLARRIPSDPHLVAYWPMEDGQGATQAYSPIPGVAPMRTAGMQFGSDDSLPGSDALPVVSSPASISGTVPGGATAGQWRVEFVYKLDTAPSVASNWIHYASGGTVRTWRLLLNSGTIELQGVDADGNSIVDATLSPVDNALVYGQWVRQQFTVSQSGSTVSWAVTWIGIGATAGASYGGTYTGTAGTCTGVNSAFSTQTVGSSIGHVAVFSTASTNIFDNADVGFDGETADARIVRLGAEESLPITFPYGHPGTAQVGPQTPDTFLNLVGAAADADIGILYEQRDDIALAYRPRVSLYNQPVTLALDYARRGDVAPPLAPVEDDTDTQNDVTVSRPSGSSARATLDTGPLSTLAPPNGVGRYATSETLNAHTDDQLPDLAGWLLHLGTWDEARYPQVTVNLAAGGHLVDAATAVDVGDRAQIANPPAWLPPATIDLLVQGYTETIGWADWSIAYNCSPAGPWVVGVVGAGKADTAGCTLAADRTASATSWSLTTATGPRWVDSAGYPGEFPFDLMAAGERVTVTAITGTSTSQIATVVRAVNGVSKAQAAGTPVSLADPLVIAL